MGRSVSCPSGAIVRAYKELDDHILDDWAGFIDDLQDHVGGLWPSMSRYDKWFDNEDRAIMRNSHAYIGISEYCGLCCIWLLPREDIHGNTALAERWCTSISEKFLSEFSNLRKVAVFSNNEVLFERKANV